MCKCLIYVDIGGLIVGISGDCPCEIYKTRFESIQMLCNELKVDTSFIVNVDTFPFGSICRINLLP